MDLKRSSALDPKMKTKKISQNMAYSKKKQKKRGLTFVSLPVIPGQVTDDNINQFSKEFSKNEQPILGYCRSGGRAKSIYQAYEQHQKN
jgi:uncharacterized protein (TIGR01244 family)